MGRRASSSIHPVWFIVAAVIVLGAVVGAWALKSIVADPFRTLPAFPVADYLQNSNSLRGNTYKLEAVIDDDQLHYNAHGRLFSVTSAGEPLPLLVPTELRAVNIQKGQHFLFRVEVADKGILIAREAKKD